MRLFVEKAIGIDASAERVWQVLTAAELTSQWAGEFGATGPIESTWALGSAVLWRDAKGEVYVHGRVTAVEPAKFLRFTVCSLLAELRPTSERDEDEIAQTYSLSDRGSSVLLEITHGDFGNLSGGEKILAGAVARWDGILRRIKALAEDSRR